VVVNSASGENFPSLSADRTSLFFSSDRPGGFGATDLYVSARKK
jgi:WD40-like Beta Propeller Repeat